jgi:O-antigen ligase
MSRRGPVGGSAGKDDAARAVAGLFGLLLGLGLLKFGNPVILDHLVTMPQGLEEWRVFSWPARVGRIGLLVVFLAALTVIGRNWRPRGPWIFPALLLAWLGWQALATLGSADPALSRQVLVHEATCVLCFALGNLVLSQTRELKVFWLCVLGGFIGALGVAAQQRFGGLEATRKMIMETAATTRFPPEYIARINSNRVFGTLVYPNALAGAILLLLPLAIVAAWDFGARWGKRAAIALAIVAAGAGIGVLVASGSKAGWLLAMGMAFLALWHAPFGRTFRVSLAVGTAVAGLAAFGFLYAERLSRGATSVSARFDYWSAAARGFFERPILGHGPGSFKRVYARLKDPESEMAQLAHNDYLQQATDSGFPGFLAYTAFVWGALGWLYRKRKLWNDPLRGAVALGLAGWFAQGFVEFGLYIPATAWCAFALLGWMLSQTDPSRAGR